MAHLESLQGAHGHIHPVQGLQEASEARDHQQDPPPHSEQARSLSRSQTPGQDDESRSKPKVLGGGGRLKAREFQLWLLGQGYSQITIKHSLSYIRFLEGMGLDVDHVENVEDVLLFFAELRGKGTKTQTLNYYVKALNRYFAFRGVDIKLKYYRHRTKDTIWIPTDEEVRRILSVRWRRYDQDLRNRAMLHIAFSTGVRLGELIALNWADLDETNHLLEIRTEKSGGTRLVPIPPKVLELLIQYRKVRMLE